MGTLWQDLRYGFRILKNNPIFTVVAIISLGLGIGANTAIFQLLDAVRLRSLPVKNPQELAEIKIVNSNNRSGNFSSSHPSLTNPQWEQIRDHQESFSGVFAWAEDTFNLAQSGQVEYAHGLWVSGDFFNTLGVSPVAGRLLTVSDDHKGCGNQGVVISHQFWQKKYGGSPDVVGKTISLDGHSFEILGVTPANFFGIEIGHYYDIAAPICSEAIDKGEYSRLERRNGWWLTVMGRLRPGVNLAQASNQLDAISPSLFQETVPLNYRTDNRDAYFKFKLGAVPAGSGLSNLRRQYSDSLLMLMAIAGLVLLIACANLANLMLARASAREKEIAVRLALGASRSRLIRQLLSESLMLAGIGAFVGIVIAQFLSRFLVAFISREGSSLFVDLSMDWRLLGFTAGVAVLTGILFGLTPAFKATGMTPGSVLKDAGRGMTASKERFGLRRILVVAQVALSLTLLVGALLFVRSLQNLMGVNAGFKQEGLVITDVDLTDLKLAKERRVDYKRDLLERVRAIPGVTSAAETSIVPLSGSGWNDSIVMLNTEPAKKGVPWFNRVTPDFFKTMGSRLLAGRDFDSRDTVKSQKAAIVNETFARQFVDSGSPLGRRFQVEVGPGEPEQVYEIVGLVNDIKYQDLREDFKPIAFVAASQDSDPDSSGQFVIASDLPTVAITSAVKQVMSDANPKISLDFHVFKTMIVNGLLQDRLMATLSGFFGLLAALLATVGLYGVISYMVAQRRNEIGIRMALGADRGRIVKMILGDAGLLLIIGIVVGTGTALLASRMASSMLYGLKWHDPMTIVIAIVALAVVGLFASYLPAYRASKVDPMNALRYE